MVRVLIAEDQNLVRGALVALLQRESDLTVVAELDEGTRIVERARESQADVAVIDVGLPGQDGISAAAELREFYPSCRALIVTAARHPGTVRRALDARVNGFLLKDVPSDKLARAIRIVATGRRVVDSELARVAWEKGKCPLVTRELEVLRMTADGHSVEDVAQAVFLSTGTVRNYLTSAVGKLAARNRIDAIRIAVDAGWI